MPPLIWLSLFFAVLLGLLLPFLFGEIMVTSLAKLHVSPDIALLVIVGMLVGGFVNIPVARFARHDVVPTHPFAAFGLSQMWPQLQRVRRETVVAVNFGGCVVPTALALYELAYLAIAGWRLLAVTGLACLANSVLCYRIARPLPGVGIVMPGLVSSLAAALMALLLAPDQAAPVAFIAGVAGPLIGADLFHLRDIGATDAAVVSIGGAGTFDGIVLSGIVAAYLA